MFFDNIGEIFAPMQIILVMVIALIVFGPKRLPELGKQLGQALREFNKAKGELMKHLSLDHEPEHEPYNYTPPTDYSQSYNAYNSYSDYNSGYTPPPDLTDYTIAGQPVREHAANGAVSGTVARSANGHANTTTALDDYAALGAYTGGHPDNGHADNGSASHSDGHAAVDAAHASPVSTAAVEAAAKGETNV